MSWIQARQKISEGKEYRDTIDVPFGGETIELSHRLLTESELMEIEATIDRQQMVEHIESEMSDAEQRFQELQSKAELTASEERELTELGQQIQAEQAGIMDSMGEETFDAFMDAGRKAIVPSEEDIDAHFDMTSDEQRSIFGFAPTTRDEMHDAIKDDMVDMVQDQPYPIKLIIGQKAYGESLSLLGDTDVDAGNPT